MQSIIDKLQTAQTFEQSITELLLALQRTNDPARLCTKLEPVLRELGIIISMYIKWASLCMNSASLLVCI